MTNPAISTVTLTDCTISGNSAGTAGGGLANSGTATLTNCTVSGNTSTDNGGGLVNLSAANLTVIDGTVSGNTAKNLGGGGIFNAGAAKLTNTINAGNNASPGPDADGAVTSEGFNLVGITDGSSGWVSSDLKGTGPSPLNPLLAALGNYGGPTQTLALLPGSPAIEAGSSPVTTDQRGVSRPNGTASDIGAFESSGFTMVTSGSGQSANITEPFASSLVVTVTAKNPVEPVVGGQVSFGAPNNGASASLSVKLATIASNGTASTAATANLFAGPYSVTATAIGVTSHAPFSLTNLASLVVNSTSDAAYTAPGVNTLRLAITYANTFTSGTPSITFDPSSFRSAETIQIDSALPDLSNTAVPLAIFGPGASLLRIQGGGSSSNYRGMTIDQGVTAIISDLTIADFAVAGNGGGINDNGGSLTITNVNFTGDSAAGGGGFYNLGTVSVEGASFTNNHAASGGAIDNQHDLTLTTSTLVGNNATGDGGGLFSTGPALEVFGCTLAGNTATEGGGVWVDASSELVTLLNSTLSGNTATNSGGGLANQGTATLTNCTVSANKAASGGGAGLYNHGVLSLFSSTVSNNSGGALGGDGLLNTGGTATLTDTIIAGNTNASGNPNDIGGGVSVSPASTFNLIGTGGSGDIPTAPGTGNIVLTSLTSLGLAPLSSYGGATQTMALLPGSSAIGAGHASSGIPSTDQRGQSRSNAVDIGAFESQGFELVPTTASTPQTAVIGNRFAKPLTVMVKANNPVEPVDGGVIQFTAPTAGAGASATLSGDMAAIAGGAASVTATANSWIGSYAVGASTAGATSIGFALTNTESQSLAVTTTADFVDGVDNLTRLREAIAFANSDPGPHTITLAPAFFDTSPRTITLTGGPLVLTNPAMTTIRGPGEKLLTIRGNGKSRVFDIEGGSLTLSGLTVSGGNAELGGGLFNTGELVLDHVSIRGNSAHEGGGLFNDGKATLRDVTITRNDAAVGGGVVDLGSMSLDRVTIRQNSARVASGLFRSRAATLIIGSRRIGPRLTTSPKVEWAVAHERSI